jgi:hypothetical protein
MKLLSFTLLGLISAESDKFLQEAFDAEAEEDQTNSVIIGSGACINWSFPRNRYFDLKKFDTEFRKDNLPANIDFSGNKFYYKACQTPW